MRQIWLAHQTRSAPDAIRDVAFGGSWEGMKAFTPAEYLHDISDFTTDRPSMVESIRPLRSLVRRDHGDLRRNRWLRVARVCSRDIREWETSILPMVLDGSSAVSITVDGMGAKWSKVTLAVTIADRAGAAVPFSYGATVTRGETIAN
jgi:hypothetical protein